MSTTEYLTFIPLLFYGLALSELLHQWRRFFDIKSLYLPYFLTTIMFTEIAVWNIFLYLEIVSLLEEVTYLRYWGYLLQPMVFLILVSALTPDTRNQDTEPYFRKRMALVFSLMALYIALHFSFATFDLTSFDTARLAAMAICLAIAITRKVELVYVMTLIWAISILARM